MIEKTFETPKGTIHYWTNAIREDRKSLVFLPGQTATAKSFNRRWTKGEGLPIEWIPGAGHNSSTDRPGIINELIKNFLH